jgi:hypothetical protein
VGVFVCLRLHKKLKNMNKVNFEYELQLSDEIQNKYSELSEATALPIIVNILMACMRHTEQNMETIIEGFHAIYKRRGLEGLRKSVPLVQSLYDCETQPTEENLKEVEKQLNNLF